MPGMDAPGRLRLRHLYPATRRPHRRCSIVILIDVTAMSAVNAAAIVIQISDGSMLRAQQFFFSGQVMIHAFNRKTRAAFSTFAGAYRADHRRYGIVPVCNRKRFNRFEPRIGATADIYPFATSLKLYEPSDFLRLEFGRQMRRRTAAEHQQLVQRLPHEKLVAVREGLSRCGAALLRAAPAAAIACKGWRQHSLPPANRHPR